MTEFQADINIRVGSTFIIGQQRRLIGNCATHRLTSGCTLLIAGSIADVVGRRLIYLIGCVLLGCFSIACALAQTGPQMIVFRGFQGVAASMCLPTAISIITTAFPHGTRRNVGFASLGAGQPVGWSFGLVLGGLFANSVGWRTGFYMCAGLTALVFLAGVWGIAQDRHIEPFVWRRLLREIDWVGAVIASACLGMLSYVLALVKAPISHRFC